MSDYKGIIQQANELLSLVLQRQTYCEDKRGWKRSSTLGQPIQVRLEGESVWLTQRLLAELYEVSVSTINEHIAHIFVEEESRPEATIDAPDKSIPGYATCWRAIRNDDLSLDISDATRSVTL